jgi:hypothetical protein
MSIPKIMLANAGAQIRVFAPLAEEIGLNESIMLLQLDYWINHAKPNEIRLDEDGKYWLIMSMRSMKTRCLGFWSLDTISRVIDALVKLGLVEVARDARRKPFNIHLIVSAISKLKSIQVSIAKSDTNDPSVRESDTNDGFVSESRTQDAAISDTIENQREEEERTPPPPRVTTDIQAGETGHDKQKPGDAIITALREYVVEGNNETKLTKAAITLARGGYTAEDVRRHKRWWFQDDWRGKRGSPPCISQVIETINAAKVWGGQTTKPTSQKAARGKPQHDCPVCGGGGYVNDHGTVKDCECTEVKV